MEGVQGLRFNLLDGWISNMTLLKGLCTCWGPGLRASQASELQLDMLYESQFGLNRCKPCHSRSCLRRDKFRMVHGLLRIVEFEGASGVHLSIWFWIISRSMTRISRTC